MEIKRKYSKKELLERLEVLKIDKDFIDRYFQAYSRSYPEFLIDDIVLPTNDFRKIKDDLIEIQHRSEFVFNSGFFIFEYFYTKKYKDIQKNPDFITLDKIFNLTNKFGDKWRSGKIHYARFEDYVVDLNKSYEILDKIKEKYKIAFDLPEFMSIFSSKWKKHSKLTLSKLLS
ncbi:MAG: hypothetical protein CMD65_02335, partial [Gammaproteobacteria bacterium]|nr:hypothetical protein [Gammaproteobacteria bacterium]